MQNSYQQSEVIRLGLAFDASTVDGSECTANCSSSPTVVAPLATEAAMELSAAERDKAEFEIEYKNQAFLFIMPIGRR